MKGHPTFDCSRIDVHHLPKKVKKAESGELQKGSTWSVRAKKNKLPFTKD